MIPNPEAQNVSESPVQFHNTKAAPGPVHVNRSRMVHMPWNCWRSPLH